MGDDHARLIDWSAGVACNVCSSDWSPFLYTLLLISFCWLSLAKFLSSASSGWDLIYRRLGDGRRGGKRRNEKEKKYTCLPNNTRIVLALCSRSSRNSCSSSLFEPVCLSVCLPHYVWPNDWDECAIYRRNITCVESFLLLLRTSSDFFRFLQTSSDFFRLLLYPLKLGYLYKNQRDKPERRAKKRKGMSERLLWWAWREGKIFLGSELVSAPLYVYAYARLHV
jgi:hypothetical protein